MSPVVSPGRYYDPNNPDASKQSLNPEVADAITLSPSYGQKGRATREEQDSEDRNEWRAAEWKDLAAEYGLSTAGTKQQVVDRVLSYEDELLKEKGGDE